MGPLVIHKDPETAIRAILVRLHPNMATETEALLKQLWSEVAPGITPQFGLLQDDLVNSFRDPRKMFQSIGIKNYLTVAIRNIARNKTFSAINILGYDMWLLSRCAPRLWIECLGVHS